MRRMKRIISIMLTAMMLFTMTGFAEEPVEEPLPMASNAEEGTPEETLDEEAVGEADEALADEVVDISGEESSEEHTEEPTSEITAESEELQPEESEEPEEEPSEEAEQENSALPASPSDEEAEPEVAPTAEPLPAERMAQELGITLEELAAELDVSMEELLLLDEEALNELYGYALEDSYDIIPVAESNPDFEIDENGVLTAYVGDSEEVVIPEGVMEIGKEAFTGNARITSVHIPNSVVKIGYRAFYGCINLRGMNIPDSVQSIEAGAFWGCESLETIKLPSALREIPSYMFNFCTMLNTIEIPDSVTVFGKNAFSSCENLQELHIPDGVIKIPRSLFWNCDKLVRVNIPSSVTEIEDLAFASCYNLRSITIPANVRTFGQTIFSSGVNTTVRVYPGSFAVDYCEGAGLRYILIPEATKLSVPSEKLFAGVPARLEVWTGKEAKYLYIAPKEASAGAETCWTQSQCKVETQGESKIWTVDYTFDQGGEQTLVVSSSIDGVSRGTAIEQRVTVARRIERITLSETEIEITGKRNSPRLYCEVYPENATNSRIIWKSSDPQVVECDYTFGYSSYVYPVGYGSATITCEAEDGGGAYAECKVTVIPALVTGIKLNKSSLTLAKDSNATLKATVTPYEADNKDVTWTSDNEDVATVENGLVTAVEIGEANITCEATDGSGVHAECKVIVEPGITYLDMLNITVGESKTPSVHSNKDVKFTYASSDTKVVTVSKKGKITAKRQGTATITVTGQTSQQQATCEVHVFPKPAKVKLNIKKASVNINEPLQLVATVEPATAMQDVTWKSSKQKIVTVDADGTIHALATGTAKITATGHAGKKVTCTVTVKKAPTSATISTSELELGIGEVNTLKMTLIPKNSFANITWASSDEKVVSVQEGKITALSEGSAIITATMFNLPEVCCKVTVKAAPTANNAKLSPENPTIQVKAKQQMSVSYMGAAGAVKSWKSSKKAVATISKTGLVTGKKKGATTITATLYNGVKITTVVTVTK